MKRIVSSTNTNHAEKIKIKIKRRRAQRKEIIVLDSIYIGILHGWSSRRHRVRNTRQLSIRESRRIVKKTLKIVAFSVHVSVPISKRLHSTISQEISCIASLHLIHLVIIIINIYTPQSWNYYKLIYQSFQVSTI